MQLVAFKADNGLRGHDSAERPDGLTATPVSTTQINLGWTASTDDVGVAGYRVFRNGAQVGTSRTTSYQDTGLSPATTYSYTVQRVRRRRERLRAVVGGERDDAVPAGRQHATLGLHHRSRRQQHRSATP